MATVPSDIPSDNLSPTSTAPTSLERWVTVCAWTRRVRWQGRWMSFEEFLAQRFNLLCTHGICEEEAERLRRIS